MQLYLRVRTHAVIRGQRTPPYKTAGLVLSLAMVAVMVLVYCQFRGAFLHIERLTMISGRAGLSMDKTSADSHHQSPTEEDTRLPAAV